MTKNKSSSPSGCGDGCGSSRDMFCTSSSSRGKGLMPLLPDEERLVSPDVFPGTDPSSDSGAGDGQEEWLRELTELEE